MKSRAFVIPSIWPTRFAFLALLTLLALPALLSGCGGTEMTAGTDISELSDIADASDMEQPVSGTELLLDTVCTITLYQPADQEILDAAFALIAAEEALLSLTVEGSDVWRVNRAAGSAVTVQPDTAELVSLGLEYSRLSGGKFDITVGALTELWDFGGAEHVPTRQELGPALASVDYRGLSLDGLELTLDDPEARLELGAIAKGYIADKTADLLREMGVTCAVIDLGGNVLTLGDKPDGSPWNIGVQQPFGAERSELIGVVRAQGSVSLVTSGIYERNFEQDGVLYHHILDPATGYPADTDVLGVTVVCQSSARGDALSTVCLLLGREQGWRLLETCEGVLGAVWVDRDGQVYVQGDIQFVAAQ